MAWIRKLTKLLYVGNYGVEVDRHGSRMRKLAAILCTLYMYRIVAFEGNLNRFNRLNWPIEQKTQKGGKEAEVCIRCTKHVEERSPTIQPRGFHDLYGDRSIQKAALAPKTFLLWRFCNLF